MENQVSQTIKTPNVEEPIDANRQKAIEHEQRVAIWKWVGKIALLVYSILVFARIPVIGSYVDGMIDYVFGQSKYAFYAFLFFAEIGFIFPTKYSQVVKTKRFVFFSLICLLSIGCIISGVANMIKSLDNPITFVELVKNYHTDWFAYFKTWDYSSFFNSGCISGGILSEIISFLFNFLSYVMLITIGSIILIICIFIILNINYRSTKLGLKIRSWMIRKLGGTFKYDGYNELKAKKDNQNKVHRVRESEVIAAAATATTIPFKLLPSSDVNRFDDNFKFAQRLQTKLLTLFRSKSVYCQPSDINVFTSYSEICFEAENKEQINGIVKLQQEIAKTTKLSHFDISINDRSVKLEIDNVYFSKHSLRTVLNMYGINQTLTAIFALDKTNRPVIQNFKTNPSVLILGKKGSGAATLSVLMALSTCYLTHPDDLELVILNPNCEATFDSFRSLPHTLGKKYDTTKVCVEQLLNIQRVINERKSLLQQANADSIDNYNKTIDITKQKLKNILVLIGNFDTLLRDTYQNTKVINDILANGPSVGIYLVLQAYTLNNDILDPIIINYISDKYVCALSSKDESMKLFNSNRGYVLHGNGDCLHFANKDSKMERIQICNLNYSELHTDIGIIKMFHEEKIRQKEQKILSEAQDGK